MDLLDFATANICVYFQYLFYAFKYAPIFWRSCINLRFKIDIVVMII
jgi:hypothetical protein